MPEVTQDPVAAEHADLNGGSTEPQAGDDELVRLLRQRMAITQNRVTALRDQLAALEPQLKRDQRALDLLTGETIFVGRGRRPGPKPQGGGKAREVPSKIGPERLTEVEGFIRDYTRDHEEFRQVDIRSKYRFASGSAFTSGTSAQAFEALRQQNVIRVARVEGNAKWYRLTREALREQ